MNSTERLKKAIEYIKSKNGTLTNDGISKSLRYRSPSYVSDLLGGSKPINDIFLSKLQDEYSINAHWITDGKGEMVLLKEITNNDGAGANPEILGNYLKEYLKEKEARRLDAEKTNATLTEIINTNLNAIQQLLLTIHRHDMAYHETILTTLGRLEELEDPRSLIVEADRVEADIIQGRQRKGKKVGGRR